jgi:hypothetical protein
MCAAIEGDVGCERSWNIQLFEDRLPRTFGSAVVAANAKLGVDVELVR